MITLADIKERWLTWRTGMDKSQREYNDWAFKNRVWNAHNVQNYYQGFKYVIEVDYRKVFKYWSIHPWEPVDDLIPYTWPHKSPGDHCEVGTFRGEWDPWQKQFNMHDFGYDATFIATNNKEDAIVFALKYA